MSTRCFPGNWKILNETGVMASNSVTVPRPPNGSLLRVNFMLWGPQLNKAVKYTQLLWFYRVEEKGARTLTDT